MPKQTIIKRRRSNRQRRDDRQHIGFTDASIGNGNYRNGESNYWREAYQTACCLIYGERNRTARGSIIEKGGRCGYRISGGSSACRSGNWRNYTESKKILEAFSIPTMNAPQQLLCWSNALLLAYGFPTMQTLVARSPEETSPPFKNRQTMRS